MDRIKNILSILKKTDINLIKNYVRCIARSNKKQLMLDYIINQKTTDEVLLLLNEKHTTNLKKIEERLLSDIEDVILLRLRKKETNNLYEKNRTDVIVSLLLADYYITNDITSEACLKLSKVKKILDKHEFPLLELIYRQLLCTYLEGEGDKKLEDELLKLSETIVEFNYLNRLKIKRENKNLNTDDNESLLCETNMSGHLFITICYRKLTEIEVFIKKKEIDNAEEEARSLLATFTTKYKSIPTELIIEVWLQIIKINILRKSYSSNKLIFERINIMNYNSVSLKNKCLCLNFINHFQLGEYDLCSYILKYADIDSKIRNVRNKKNTSQWDYFEMCLLFMRKEYGKVLKCIDLLVNEKNISEIILVNTKTVEIYTLALLRKNKNVLYQKMVALKCLFGDMGNDKYLKIVCNIEKICSLGKYSSNEILKEYSQDILNCELIPFVYFKNEYIKLNSTVKTMV